jgi:eukaryotic-like serine/threonine-protein kinase
MSKPEINDDPPDPRSETLPRTYGAVSDFSPGSVVAGKYLVEHAIGEGGLGLVVKAKHLQLDAPVAIKYLKPSDISRQDVVERFLREARLAARIKNEHAVKVQDVDTLESGVPYMVMEFLEGQDLAQLVLQSPLPLDRAIDYVLQACEALAEAHAVGIVHRDLKPANLFLTTRPGGASLVKVLDFGISRLSTDRKARVTRVDERIGTPEFMSPEQLQGAPDVDARADIWGLGVVLYELLTGKLPFEGEGLAQLCTSILTKPHVPLSAVHPDATLEIEAVVARCLEKDRDKRYQNIAELAQDLAVLWEGESPSRVQQIARVMREAGAKISPPTPFPGSIQLPVPAPAVQQPPFEVIQPDASLGIEGIAPADVLAAVFTDAAGAKVDELQFVSIDEAYDFACSQSDDVVRCDLYDELEGVRGRLRVTYVRSPETGHWVPLLA